MSTTLHSLIIVKGATVKYFCKDGLSSLTVMHIGEILNFGGNFEPVNCGGGNIYAALDQAKKDTYQRY